MSHKYKHNQTIKIELFKLNDPTEILAIMRQHNILYYVYLFVSPDGVLKYGQSSCGNGQPGERIYRQAGHLAGWSKRLSGSSGSDMRIIADDYQDRYSKTLNKNDVFIYVINMTNLPAPDCYNIEFQCKDLEKSLIQECIEFYGQAPIGNRDPDTKLMIRRHRVSEVFNKLFEVTE